MTQEQRRQADAVVVPYEEGHRSAALDVAIRSWEPVFPVMREAVPPFVYDCFYPQGWRARQIADLGRVLDAESERVAVAVVDGEMAGWVSWRIHEEDSMGEVYVLTVAPEFQRRGVGRALLDHAHDQVRRAGMRMVMVETGGDPGHAPARAAYESAGYERWPVARYFWQLSDDEG